MFRQTADNSASKRALRRRAWPVVAIAIGIFLLGLVRVCRLAEGRMPTGDTFAFCTMQYSFFFNSPALRGHIPLWNPFVCHGSPAAWNVFTVMNMGTATVALCAPLLKHCNFLLLYHLCMLFDEIVLLLGSFLLARRYCTSLAAAIFVIAFILGAVSCHK